MHFCIKRTHRFTNDALLKTPLSSSDKASECISHLKCDTLRKLGLLSRSIPPKAREKHNHQKTEKTKKEQR